jgi:hypothetical protein
MGLIGARRLLSFFGDGNQRLSGLQDELGHPGVRGHRLDEHYVLGKDRQVKSTTEAEL